MKFFKLFGVIFTLAGIGLLIGACFSYNESRKFVEHSVEATGVVKDLIASTSSSSSGTSTIYHPLVSFKTAKGEIVEFKNNIGSNPPSYKRGEEVPVRYDPNNPQDASIDSFVSLWFYVMILGGMGAIFSGLGVTFLLLGVFSSRKDKWLQESGQLISTEFRLVERNLSETIGGQHPYQIISQWVDPQTNKIYVFKSKNLPFNPENFIQKREIGVRIDPQNPAKYLMDTSFLPQEGN
jgi:hypothetical protein